MKKTTFRFSCTGIFALVFLFVLSTGSFAAEPIKMKIGLSNDPGSPRVRGAELFAKLINERTNGQVEVKVLSLFPAWRHAGDVRADPDGLSGMYADTDVLFRRLQQDDHSFGPPLHVSRH